jgi:3-deoxy-7-phosphoheptulonate synthase
LNFYAKNYYYTFNMAINSQNPCFLPSPEELKTQLPCPPEYHQSVTKYRETISNIIHGRDQRLLVICGPCSVHDLKAIQEYAERLAQKAYQWRDHLFCVMRCYVEKPRTRQGWQGLAQNPSTLTPTLEYTQGLTLARTALLRCATYQLPLATELLHPLFIPYWEDLLAWGAIGARTVESQIHRHLASAMPFPVGIKNRTDGNIAVAVDALWVAQQSHPYFYMHDSGKPCAAPSMGNPNTHLVLRGGTHGPNWHPDSLAYVAEQLSQEQLPTRICIDLSHGNSGKNHLQQIEITKELLNAKQDIYPYWLGVMCESFLIEGRADPEQATFGQSITDPCLSWEQTEQVLELLAQSRD